MKIGLRGGHSPNCKGAMGILDEQVEVRKIYNALVPMLQAAGHVVVNCNSNANSVNAELSEGTNKANNAGCEAYITIHMNASGGAGNGTEVWMYNTANGTMNSIASRICQNFAAKGFQNRGTKVSTELHDLNASAMPAMIVETLFCDNQHDANLCRQIGIQGIARLIAEGIKGKTVTANKSQPKTNSKGKGEATMYCTYKITDLSKDKVYFFNGAQGKSYPLEHPDELKILRQIYKDNNGHDLPHYEWVSKAPWFTRLKGATSGEAANFFIK
ncbi:N-acetylmuramoyl-L-alanine amidase [Clostridioides difficile]|nr:N-acetylmuramoyl-L-alanine amidase [Clostridioides difficile]